MDYLRREPHLQSHAMRAMGCASLRPKGDLVGALHDASPVVSSRKSAPLQWRHLRRVQAQSTVDSMSG